MILLSSPLFAIKQGEKIKEFYLRDYNGELHYSRDLCGSKMKKPSVLIIDFFATWCRPCINTLEILKKLNQRYAKKGLKVVLISFQEKEKSIREFVGTNSVPFPILMDKYGEMAKEFGVYGLPRTFIISADCTLKKQIIGELLNLEEVLEKEVKDGLGVK